MATNHKRKPRTNHTNEELDALVLAKLEELAGDDCRVAISSRAMAARVGVSNTTANAALGRLVASGLVRRNRQRKTRFEGGRAPFTYFLHPDVIDWRARAEALQAQVEDLEAQIEALRAGELVPA